MTYDMKARPTTYNGIKMRSRLEAKYAGWLDLIQVGWRYEPLCLANADGQYLPDFLVSGVYFGGNQTDVAVEVKPTVSQVPPVEEIERQALLTWQELGAPLVYEIASESEPYLATKGGTLVAAAWCFDVGPSGRRIWLGRQARRGWG